MSIFSLLASLRQA